MDLSSSQAASAFLRPYPKVDLGQELCAPPLSRRIAFIVGTVSVVEFKYSALFNIVKFG